ncbi:hypothetical protein [Photorhabdus khanii]|uniref:hypothetical protein n=1 Tax=Photorhabdus khanii TaxID=1004150 RepID=UPI001396C58E|nr:hypothetical protein [Photorhabdus khanii]
MAASILVERNPPQPRGAAGRVAASVRRRSRTGARRLTGAEKKNREAGLTAQPVQTTR